MNSPTVSIILATYNGSKYLANAINSVLSQTYSNFDFIIVNDASTDNTENIILEYKKKDARIVYIKNEINLEKSLSKNKWVDIAKWRFVAFIDDDDIWFDKNKLQKQVDFLNQNNEYWIVGTNAICRDENKNEIGKIIVKTYDNEIRKNILLTNQFIQSSILIKKDLFLQFRWFSEWLNFCEDYDLWLRIWVHTKMANLNDFCVYYTIRKNSTTWKNFIKMKFISLQLIFGYNNIYPNFFLGIFMKLATFFIPINTGIKLRSLVE